MRYLASHYAKALYQLLDGATESQRRERIRQFAATLRKHNRGRAMQDLIRAFEAEYNAREGVTRVEIESAGRIDVEALLKELGVGRRTEVVQHERPELIGGVRIRIDDTRVDNSVSGRLNRLKRQVTT
jgi:F-type H+-transporting ATPase subunit delta